MGNRRRKSPLPRTSPPSMSSMPNLQSKLRTLASRHENLKSAFHQLKAQIKSGLLQAEEVYASLSIPLTTLVGLKTDEMTHEGRFTTILMDPNECHDKGIQSEMPMISPSSVYGTHHTHNERLEDSKCVSRAAMKTSKELREKQYLQLTQLVSLLRKIETQVNASQSHIFQTLVQDRIFLHKVFQRAASYIYSMKSPSQNRDAHLITLKLLEVTSEHVDAALTSVESGIEDLMHILTEEMCNPMVVYVRDLKNEMERGTCNRLLALVEEMGMAIREGRIELEEAKEKARLEEERNLESLRRLTETEERMRRMKEQLTALLEDKKNSASSFVPHKLIDTGYQEKDEKPLWEMLRRKRKHRTLESPQGAKGLLYLEPNRKTLTWTRESFANAHKPASKSHSRPLTPFLDSRLFLGTSPSAVNQQVGHL